MLPNAYILPVEGMPPFGSGLKPARQPVTRAVHRALRAASTKAMDRGLPGLNRLRTDYGLDPLAHLWDQLHQADLELVMTSKAFDFEGAVPPHARYVGPVLDDPPWAERWTPPPGDDPLVLVAMSSTYQEQYGCLERVVTALADLPVRGLVTAGPALDATVIPSPPNVTVVQSAPHNQVLRHARVVITHGGHGTVVKSLAAGVPLLVLPHGRDQGDNAARVSARGAGLSLRRTARPARITAALRRLMDDPRYVSAARTLGEHIRADAAAPTLVTEVERLATVSR
jgi:MGT family glycosyltransferase